VGTSGAALVDCRDAGTGQLLDAGVRSPYLGGRRSSDRSGVGRTRRGARARCRHRRVRRLMSSGGREAEPPPYPFHSAHFPSKWTTEGASRPVDEALPSPHGEDRRNSWRRLARSCGVWARGGPAPLEASFPATNNNGRDGPGASRGTFWSLPWGGIRMCEVIATVRIRRPTCTCGRAAGMTRAPGAVSPVRRDCLR